MNVLSDFASAAKRFLPESGGLGGPAALRLVIAALVGVGLLILGGVAEKKEEPQRTMPPEAVRVEHSQPRSYEEALEARLVALLSQVRGAGTVAVNVTLESGGYQEVARNTVRESRVIQEKDAAGGIRTTTENKENDQILLSKEGNQDRPVIVREQKPVIKGVLVIAEGAADSTVKAGLTRAVEAGLGIPSHRITVLPQRR